MSYYPTRNKERVNYDEREPEFFDHISSGDESILILGKDSSKKKKKSKEKIKDDEDYNPANSPVEPPDTFIIHKKSRKRAENMFPILKKTNISAMAPALLERLRRSENDPSLYVDPTGKPCPFVPYSEVVKNIFKPDQIFKTCNNVNTLMPAYDPTSTDKFQYFKLDSQIATFDFNYIRRLSDEELEYLLQNINDDLNELYSLQINDCYLVPPFKENLKKSFSIKANVLDFDWEGLGKAIQFDVILMDPPWIIQQNPNKVTRGVELGYDQMEENAIATMPLDLIQTDGYVFMWVVAREFSNGLKMLERWGYQVINDIHWIKTSRRGIYQPSNGHYLQHAKESLLIGVKGKGCPFMRKDKFTDKIIQPRNLRQSHKPNKLYKIIESIFPGGTYIELFARSHNLRSNWVSLGLEVP